ncbi:MAG: tRNA (N(6)-L-threonylcarbamoyladenosine(37)-C(2))-methylthiotransferase MtaB [Helicobacteraceae bacterium]|nr:tRNA (N(6)-L-threonylcarbamoyladenosine(37)-C(2))-methylthiotransferase MtaB [Helicobacteraceae bacterium]
MKTVYFKTFGCRSNFFDTSAIAARLNEWQIVDSEADSDAIVVNSCTVTNSADAAVRAFVRRMKRENPKAKLLFTGCGAASLGKKLLESAAIDGVFGHSEKARIDDFLSAEKPFEELGVLDHIDETIIDRFNGKTRAFIKIQDGCDFDCSYCVIPLVRGKARSASKNYVLEQIKRLADRGFEEFILTGVNSGAYGRDRGENIADLIASIGNISGVRRLRLSSIEPCLVSDELLDICAAPFMAKHLHIALQHTSDRMLKTMNRRNRVKSDRILLEKVSKLGFAIGSDYIVSFPSESEEVFSEAIDNLKLLPLTHIHIFPFSPREGTKAAKMKININGLVANERRKTIVKIIDQKKRDFYLKNKEPLIVLIERNNSGLDQFFSRVQIISDCDHSGWVEVKKYSIDKNGVIEASKEDCVCL